MAFVCLGGFVLPLLKSAFFKQLLMLLYARKIQNLLGWLLTFSLFSSREQNKTIALTLCMEEWFAPLWLHYYFSHIIDIHCFHKLYARCMKMTFSSTTVNYLSSGKTNSWYSRWEPVVRSTSLWNITESGHISKIAGYHWGEHTPEYVNCAQVAFYKSSVLWQGISMYSVVKYLQAERKKIFFFVLGLN